MSKLFIILLLFFPLFLHAQSFDCTKAGSRVEKIICSDSYICRQDEEVEAIYNDLIKSAPDRAYLINDVQHKWLDMRNKCESADCVKKAYQEYIDWYNYNEGIYRTLYKDRYKFHCANPLSYTSRLVCGDAELLKLDREVDQSQFFNEFHYIMSNSINAKKSYMQNLGSSLASSDGFMNELRNKLYTDCIHDKQCIKDTYTAVLNRNNCQLTGDILTPSKSSLGNNTNKDSYPKEIQNQFDMLYKQYQDSKATTGSGLTVNICNQNLLDTFIALITYKYKYVKPDYTTDKYSDTRLQSYLGSCSKVNFEYLYRYNIELLSMVEESMFDLFSDDTNYQKHPVLRFDVYELELDGDISNGKEILLILTTKDFGTKGIVFNRSDNCSTKYNQWPESYIVKGGYVQSVGSFTNVAEYNGKYIFFEYDYSSVARYDPYLDEFNYIEVLDYVNNKFNGTQFILQRRKK